MEGTVALKLGLVHRGMLDHATIREPLKNLSEKALQWPGGAAPGHFRIRYLKRLEP